MGELESSHEWNMPERETRGFGKHVAELGNLRVKVLVSSSMCYKIDNLKNTNQIYFDYGLSISTLFCPVTTSPHL